MKKILFAALLCSASLLPFASQANDGKSTFGLGVEGFTDTYNEPEIDVETTTTSGSVTGYYSYEQTNMFAAADGRVSYGTTDYESSSGTLSGIPEWEFELRGRLGYSFPLWGGSMSPYTGLGGRYFMQQGKGRYTNLFAFAYDRRIAQIYVPVGASYAFTTNSGWTITPMAEVDFFLYGDVNSRLANGSSLYYNINNTQNPGSGYGIRSELMFGKVGKTTSWQFGPFVRYWKVNDSELTTAPDGSQWLEPKNDRTQVGVAVRVLW